MSDNPETPIRYSVVGLGRAGWNIHVAALRNRADATIVAVVDPVAERRAQAQNELGCRAYTTLAALLKQTDIDVVVLATPSAHHGAESKRVLRSGRHVVVEKPMAMSVAEADSMIGVAHDSGRRLFVHQNYRFFPEFLHLKEIVDSNLLGRIFHIRNYVTNFNRRNDWQTLSKNGGGVLNNTCPHFIDQVLQLIGGSIVSVFGDLKQIASAGDVEDHVKLLLKSDNAATADIEISNVQNLPAPLPKWILCGEHGTLVSDGKTSTIRWFDPALVRPLEVREGPAADRKYGNDDKLPWQEKIMPAEPSSSSRENFYDNVFGVLRRAEPMRITPQSVREVIRVMAMARKGSAFPGKNKTHRQVLQQPSQASSS